MRFQIRTEPMCCMLHLDRSICLEKVALYVFATGKHVDQILRQVLSCKRFSVDIAYDRRALDGVFRKPTRSEPGLFMPRSRSESTSPESSLTTVSLVHILASNMQVLCVVV